MSDSDNPKMWISHYDLTLGVRGSSNDTLDDVRDVFHEELEDAVERDAKLTGNEDTERGVE